MTFYILFQNMFGNQIFLDIHLILIITFIWLISGSILASAIFSGKNKHILSYIILFSY